MPKIAPHGTWPSPITGALVAEAGVGLSTPWLDDDCLYWTELRPTEAGRYVLVRRDENGEIGDVTPPGMSVRTRVHEYGGGAFAIHRGVVYFCNDSDQRLYRHQPDSDAGPRALTPEPETRHGLRYADMHVSRDGAWLVCVRERHEGDREPVNEIIALPADASPETEPVVVAGGHDFFAAPRLDPTGRRLAWLAWDHPRMPWDGTELYVADFDPRTGAGDVQKIAGGASESVLQPAWSPSGTLHFVSDRSGWWNLYAHGREAPLAAVEAELGLPMWAFGQARYAFVGERVVVAYIAGGRDHLALLDAGAGALREIDTPYSSLGYHLACDGKSTVAVAGGAFDRATEIATLELSMSDTGGQAACTVIKRSMDLEVDAADLSRPRAIAFPTADGDTAHALYYPPASKDHAAPDGDRPPLMVRSHGGPTASASSTLSLAIQFWTSRGFAVVDVDYRGSTGYGRAYRQRLNQQWGVVDTQDCVDAARYLAGQGEVDGARMVIRGGSAGGYTTLCALAFHDAFAAGASYYGVGDLEALARHTHKFESRYLDSLIGPYPERKDDYVARSPVHHTGELSCPIILLQGLEDKVVPPEQSEAMAAALDRKGLAWAYVAFEGEQHGFRKAENIRRAIEAELYFYGRVLGFSPADDIAPVDIHNLG